jgi:hypothetical protein
MTVRTFLAAASVVALGAFSMGAASAATCTDLGIQDYALGDLSGANDGCALGTTNNDTINPLQVNADSIFGGGWTFAEKSGGEEEVKVDVGFNAASGVWTVKSNFFSLYKELLLVIKGGAADNILPNTYVAYLFSSDDGTTGTYKSPFLNTKPDPDQVAGISHMSAYYRGTGGGVVGPVPVPAGLPLLLSGIAMAGFVARRKSRKA